MLMYLQHLLGEVYGGFAIRTIQLARIYYRGREMEGDGALLALGYTNRTDRFPRICLRECVYTYGLVN